MPNHRLTQSQVLERFNERHNGFYNYSKVEYKTGHEKVIIICPVHGEFLESPFQHMNGGLCRKCDRKKGGADLLDQNDVIKRFIEIHKDTYDYSKVVYRGYRKKIEIICKIHGSFWQVPSSHLIGRGCRKCAINTQASSRWLSQNEILKRFNEKHNSKYGYDISSFGGHRSKITIHCPTHGEFFQVLGDHLAGRGCPKCPPNKKRYKNTHLYTDSLNEIKFLEELEKQHGIDWIIMNVKIPEPVEYIFNNKKKRYKPDFLINNTIYEIKSSYSWFEYRRHGRLDQINTAKLNAALQLGYEVVLVLDGIEMVWPVSVLP